MATRAPSQQTRPDRVTLAAFAGVVLIGGLNFVAVRFSNEEIEPFFGAGTRFAIAGLLFLALARARGIPMPRGEALTGAVLWGLLAFTVAYALAYFALLSLPSAVGAVIMSSVPLLTLFFALAHGVEPFRLRALIGALISIVGIAVLVNSALTLEVRALSLVAMFLAAAGAAESSVIIKRFPPSNPVATNGVAMSIGGVLLLLLSAVAGESWTLPETTRTWVSFVYLVVLGSLGLFALFLFVLRRWTASGASYQFVLMPIVAALAGAWLASEPITWGLAVGGLIILAGVYVGALSRGRARAEAPPEEEVLAQRCSSA